MEFASLRPLNAASHIKQYEQVCACAFTTDTRASLSEILFCYALQLKPSEGLWFGTTHSRNDPSPLSHFLKATTLRSFISIESLGVFEPLPYVESVVNPFYCTP